MGKQWIELAEGIEGWRAFWAARGGLYAYLILYLLMHKVTNNVQSSAEMSLLSRLLSKSSDCGNASKIDSSQDFTDLADGNHPLLKVSVF
jgi:hypothetical protein